MNRITRLVLRLYPAWWRTRYGAELEALIEDTGANWWTVLDLSKEGVTMRLVTWLGFFNPRRSIIACGLLGMITAAAVFVTTPPRYAFVSTIEIQSSDQVGQAAPITVASQAFSDTHVESLVKRFALYPDSRSGRDAIRRFREHVSLTRMEPTSTVHLVQIRDGVTVPFRDGGALQVGFSDRDQRKAQQVAAALATLIIDENLHQAPDALYRVTGLPLPQEPDGASAMAAARAGLSAALLAGIALAVLRRVHPVAYGR
jgi:hypothetical protein